MINQNLPTDTASAVPGELNLGRWFWILCVLATSGLFLTGYLAWAGITANPVAGCGAGGVFDCGHVMTSRWSKVLGVPVGVPAFTVYCTLISALVFSRLSSVPAFRRICWASVTLCGTAAGLAGLWFSGLQFLVMDHLCPWCLAAHTCGLCILTVILWKQPLGVRNTAQLASISVAGVALLVTIQSLTAPPATHVVERFDGAGVDAVTVADTIQLQDEDEETFFSPPEDVFTAPGSDVFEPPTAATGAGTLTETESETSGDETSSKAAATLLLLMAPQLRLFGSEILAIETADDISEADAETAGTDSAAETKEEKPPQASAPERRLIGVTGNRFRLDIRQWPLLGKPDARYVFVEMFDYTCQHCRNTHRSIKGAFQHFGDDLAVITLPVPLDRRCNPSAKTSGGHHRDSCEISRIAVAVWRIDPEKFHQLHDWILESARTARATRQQAEQLVGREGLQRELNFPTAAEYIARHVQLYQKVGAGSVPKLMFPNASMVGEVSSASVLCKRIERELAGSSH